MNDGITYIGIDPGANGSIAGVRDGDCGVSLPLGKMSERDKWLYLTELPEPCRVALEVVTPNRNSSNGGRAQGSHSMFTFGQGYGFLRGIIVASGFPYHCVTPKAWQPAMGIRKVADEKPTDKKNRHKARAQQLFPGVKMTHAKADAMLLAAFAKLKANELFL